jgi:hypothetical protein
VRLSSPLAQAGDGFVRILKQEGPHLTGVVTREPTPHHGCCWHSIAQRMPYVGQHPRRGACCAYVPAQCTHDHACCVHCPERKHIAGTSCVGADWQGHKICGRVQSSNINTCQPPPITQKPDEPLRSPTFTYERGQCLYACAARAYVTMHAVSSGMRARSA